MNDAKLRRTLEYLVDEHGPIRGRTRILKLVYLADHAWKNSHSHTYTEAQWHRWNHGPFAREVLTALDWLDGVEIHEEAEQTPVGIQYVYRSGTRSRLNEVELDEEFEQLLDKVAAQWGRVPLRKLLDHVYGDKTFNETDFGAPLLGTG